MRYSIVLKTDLDFLWLYKSRVSLFYYHILSIISISKQKKMMIGSDNLQKKKGRAISSFLKKTYGLLNVPSLLIQDQCNQDVVRWANNGIGFLVLDELLFSKEVLPKYFKHSNYSSFVRQVHIDLFS